MSRGKKRTTTTPPGATGNTTPNRIIAAKGRIASAGAFGREIGSDVVSVVSWW